MKLCGSLKLPAQLTEVPVVLTPDEITHVAITISYNPTVSPILNANHYVNGQLMALSSAVWLPSFQWNAQSTVQLFSASNDVHPWDGQMYLFSMYPTVLTPSQINSNYLAGIPNSLPIALNTSVTIKENGENATSHYSDPAFYLSPVPSVYLQAIDLSAYDLDEQAFCSIACSTRAPNSFMSLQITALPSIGTLYFANGSLLPLNSVLSRDASGHYAVRYRPPWNKVSASPTSPIDSFSFLAIDGTTLLPSTYPGTVSIAVSRVIKPPVVNNVNLTLVGSVLRVIPLTGSPDSNGNGVIQTFGIVTLPVSGNLYPVFKNGTISGTRISNPVNLPSQQVAYIYR